MGVIDVTSNREFRPTECAIKHNGYKYPTKSHLRYRTRFPYDALYNSIVIKRIDTHILRLYEVGLVYVMTYDSAVLVSFLQEDNEQHCGYRFVSLHHNYLTGFGLIVRFGSPSYFDWIWLSSVFLSHGMGDLVPALLKKQLNYQMWIWMICTKI